MSLISVAARIAANVAKHPVQAVRVASNHLKNTQAEAKQVARSRAMRLKPLSEIAPQVVQKFHEARQTKPQPTDIRIRMASGHLMQYFTDGSLRHLPVRIKLSKKQRRRRNQERLHEPHVA